MNRLLTACCAVSVALVVAGCVGSTEPATNVLNLSAQLNAKGYANDGPATWWWEYDTVQSDLGTANDTEVCGNPLEADRRCGPAAGAQQNQIPVSVTVTGLTPNTTYYFRACGQDTNDPGPSCANVRSFKTLAGTAYEFVRTVGTTGTLGSGRVANISGLAVDRADNLYVADRATTTEPYARVQKFSPSGAFLMAWGSRGTGNGQFTGPDGVDVDAAGRVYTIETEDPRVQVFSANGTFIRKFGGYRPAQTGELWRPTDLAVTPSGGVYVSDEFEGLEYYDEDGDFVLRWASDEDPADVARAPSGDVFMANHNPNRVEKYNALGGFLLNWGSAGTGNGQFALPMGVGTDSANAVYVVDQNTNRIQKFTSAGNSIERVDISQSEHHPRARPRRDRLARPRLRSGGAQQPNHRLPPYAVRAKTAAPRSSAGCATATWSPPRPSRCRAAPSKLTAWRGYSAGDVARERGRGPGVLRQPRRGRHSGQTAASAHRVARPLGLPDAGVYRGQAGFRQLAARFDEVLAEQQYAPLEFIDAGTEVVVPLRWTAHGRLSGASFTERCETWVFTVEEGLIRRVVEFTTMAEALEAVGLSE